MYRLTPELYDCIYDADGKDYVLEVDFFKSIFKKYNNRTETDNRRGKILDLGCGTGRHLSLLQNDYDCWGVDVDEGLLEVASKRCVSSTLAKCDMSSENICNIFPTALKFDNVLCLFSAVGYLTEVAKVQQFFHNIANLLSSTGVGIIEPWVQPGEWDTSHVGVVVVDELNRKIVRINRSGQDGNVSIVDLHYYIASEAGVESAFERHLIAMYSWEELQELANNSGLSSIVLPEGPAGHGLLIVRLK